MSAEVETGNVETFAGDTPGFVFSLSRFNLCDVVNGNPLTDVDVITSPKIV